MYDIKPFYYRDYLDSTNKIDLKKLYKNGIQYELTGWDSTNKNRISGKPINETLFPGYSIYHKTKSAEYVLAALGTVTNNIDNELDPLTTIKDFRLVLRVKQDGVISEQEVIRFEATRWSAMSYLDRIHLQWIGDIDQDGKLDIYLNFNNHHECYNSLLFLSSEAERGYHVRLVNNTEHCGG